MTSLDAKTAFDISHIKPLHRMCDIDVPCYIIRLIIINWYSKVMMILKRDNVKSGVRQDSVLSPVLFNVYFLDFRHICILKKILFLHKLSRLDNEVIKICFFRLVSLQNFSLYVMILILQLTYVLNVTFDVNYLIILVV